MEAGGVKAMLACPLAGVAIPIVGAPGTVAGVTMLEGADGSLTPYEFVAVTVNV